MTRLERLIGRKVQWNDTKVATIVEAFVHMEEKKAGSTVVGYEPNVYGVFDVPGIGLVTKPLSRERLIPEAAT